MLSFWVSECIEKLLMLMLSSVLMIWLWFSGICDGGFVVNGFLDCGYVGSCL